MKNSYLAVEEAVTKILAVMVGVLYAEEEEAMAVTELDSLATVISYAEVVAAVVVAVVSVREASGSCVCVVEMAATLTLVVCKVSY